MIVDDAVGFAVVVVVDNDDSIDAVGFAVVVDDDEDDEAGFFVVVGGTLPV